MKYLLVLCLLLSGCCGIINTQYTDPIHIVQPHETLEEISVQHYGSELQMNIIMEANHLKAKQKLTAGQKIRIPTLKF